MNYVYVLRCADDSLYIGWTNDLTHRLAAHNSGQGAKYTRGRGPVTLAFSEIFETKNEAMSYEAVLKQMTRAQKLGLIASQDEPNGESITIYDAGGRACGERPRTVVHRQGLRHHVIHLWILVGDRLYLQQRAPDRPLYPNRFDLASGGHIDPGETPADAVCREAREEIGVVLSPEQLLPLPPVVQQFPRPFGFDDEIAYPFVLRVQTVPAFEVGTEVSRMVSVPIADFERALAAQAAGEPLPLIDVDGEAISADALCCLHNDEWNALKAAL